MPKCLHLERMDVICRQHHGLVKRMNLDRLWLLPLKVVLNFFHNKNTKFN
ncbi:unnamed protein product, partial [Anisakis simplex]|uniref:Uncharacterized protein n=1 Tax=Anisakis simplex TaxID=6269 RepID=A0A0M3JIB0_ANISI